MDVLPALATGGAVFLMFLAVQAMLAGPATVDARLRHYGRPTDVGPKRVEDANRSKTAVAVHLSRALQRRGTSNRLALQLERADVRVTPSEFVMVTVILVIGVAAVSFLVLRNPAFGLLATALAFYAPRLWLWRKRQMRLKAFNDQLADAIALLANSLRSGYSLPQALELLSRDSRPPISQEFSRVNREVNLGLSPPEAMANVLSRVPSDDLDLFITAINIQREVGGNLAEVLDSIADTIRDRIKLLGEVRVLTAQQSYAGYVVTGLPIVLAAVMFLISRSYMETLFTTPLGWLMLSVAAAGITAGFFVMRKIVKIRV
jgi:tight adherence protein B